MALDNISTRIDTHQEVKNEIAHELNLLKADEKNFEASIFDELTSKSPAEIADLLIANYANWETYVSWNDIEKDHGYAALVQAALSYVWHSDVVGKVDGYYGTNTQKAVLAFQTNKWFTGKDLDGLAGPDTLAALVSDLQDLEGWWNIWDEGTEKPTVHVSPIDSSAEDFVIPVDAAVPKTTVVNQSLDAWSWEIVTSPAVEVSSSEVSGLSELLDDEIFKNVYPDLYDSLHPPIGTFSAGQKAYIVKQFLENHPEKRDAVFYAYALHLAMNRWGTSEDLLNQVMQDAIDNNMIADVYDAFGHQEKNWEQRDLIDRIFDELGSKNARKYISYVDNAVKGRESSYRES